MDVATVITAIVSSLGLTLPAAVWLSQKLIGYRLGLAKAEFEGELRKRIETELGELTAQRQYEFGARKRLYSAVGPLRFQLLIACSDLAGRIGAQAGAEQRYEMTVDGYYGKSTLYRILRPLCIAQMIERQIAIADFSVDTGAVDLLRFRKAAFNALSGDILVGAHPALDWSFQREHVFADILTRCAHALMVASATVSRTMTFHEFDELLVDPERTKQLSPFPAILRDFTPASKPIFWIRLAGYGHLCNEFVAKAGAAVGFEVRTYPTRELLALTGDRYIEEHLDDYVKQFAQLTALQL